MPIRILVVDDSVVIRKLLTATLGEVAGLEVVASVALGKLALARIEHSPPDIVILDVEMPEMDGIETLKRIRKLAPRLPVIMFSTKTERGAAATIEALTSGASDYITKPSNSGSVLAAMAKVRDEMVPKIYALTGGASGPMMFPPPMTAPVTSALAAMHTQALPRPPAGHAAAGPTATTTRIALANATSVTTRLDKLSTIGMAPLTHDGGAKPGDGQARPFSKLTTRGMVPLGPDGNPRNSETLARQLNKLTTRAMVPLNADGTPRAPERADRAEPASALRPPAGQRVEIVAIGASTGGPNALATLLTHVPPDFPVPIVIVQHMLPTFTRHFAQRLAQQCRIAIVEATDGEALIAGRVYIARGDYHLVIERRLGRLTLVMNQDELENYCRPSVDVLFRSVAQLFGGGALAIVLTGMGHDGLAGCNAIRCAGGDVIVQDEATSVVWGMPGFVARAGLASQILPIEQLGPELRRRIATSGSPPRAMEAAP